MTTTVRPPQADGRVPVTGSPTAAGGPPDGPTTRRWATRWWARFPRALRGPTALAVLSALAFTIIQPDVSDLQAALARQSAANHGVGLGYWFQWFGGGSTPGNYSVITPYLSSLVSAAAVGAVATVACTLLAYRALAGTRHPVAALWLATVLLGLNLWSGRVPFALGLAFGLVAIIALRERLLWLAVLGAVLSSMSSPVTGAFIAFAFGAAFLVEPALRRAVLAIGAACGATLLFIAWYFGTPGPQGFPTSSALMTAVAALAMLAAKPHRVIRVLLWCTALAVPVVTLVPNGMGSNWTRLPWICLPAAVLATATAPRKLVALSLLPAVLSCADVTVNDVVRSTMPSSGSAYYDSLIRQLRPIHDLRNYRLEVVQDQLIHSAANALLDHAALPGGWETQEQHKLNPILDDTKRFNAVSYRIWLNNNAVGYVALNRDATTTKPEYTLVAEHRPSYLTEISRTKRWVLFRVSDATPIVPKPARLLSADQATMRISVPCVCTFYLRVRYSKFLGATAELRDTNGARIPTAATLRDDGNGWTVVTTHSPGTYVFDGAFTRRLTK